MKKMFTLLQLPLLLMQICCFGKAADKSWLKNAPFSFRENKGQIHDQHGNPRPDVQFSLASKGMDVFVGNGQLHYQFSRTDRPADNDPKEAVLKVRHMKVPPAVSTYRVDVELVGANTGAAVIVEDPRSDVANYASQHINGIRSYGRIIYKDVYPNIDWVLYTRNNALKYDFIVHPGGNPGDIKFRYDGAASLSLVAQGKLRFTTPFGTVTEDHPYAFQQEDRKQVAADFQLQDNDLSFTTGAYKGTLVIDPGVDWATYFGDSGDEETDAVACGQNGAVYMAGGTTSMANIATVGSHQTVFGGGFGDAYLVKFDSTGVRQWSTYYGGNSVNFGFESTQSLTCDQFGHIYLLGWSTSTDGIATPGSFQDTISAGNIPIYGSIDGFLAKFNDDGSLNWGTYYGGEGVEIFSSVKCDAGGNVYFGGYGDLTGGLATPGAYQEIPAGGQSIGDALLVKFDSAGNRLWATYYGGEDDDQINGIGLDAAGNIYVGGTSVSLTGIATAGTYQPVNAGGGDGFVAKFSSVGVLQWGSYYGGPDGDDISGLATDAGGNVYIGGFTFSLTGISTPGCHQAQLGGDGTTASAGEHFLARFNNAGMLGWSTYYGGAGTELPYSAVVACDAFGHVALGGETMSQNSPVPGIIENMIATPGSHKDHLDGVAYDDLYVALFDSAGVRKWASYYGGDAYDISASLSFDPSGNLYLAGQSSSTDSIATAGSFQSAAAGGEESFLVRFVPVDLALTQVVSPANDTVCTGIQSLSLMLKNQGRKAAADTIFTTCMYTGPSGGTLDTFFTQGLAAGTTGTIALGDIDLSAAGTYTFHAYNIYTTDDSSRANDTLNFILVAVNAPSAGTITVNSTGTVNTFSATNVTGAGSYFWDFGDTHTDTAQSPSHSYTDAGSYTVTLIITNSCSSDTATKTINAIGTGINDPDLINDIVVYPNPATQALFIKATPAIALKSYRIQNGLGQVCAEGALSNSLMIDVSKLAPGFYILDMETDKGIVHKQFRILK